jgi:hypothetical protein
MCLDTLRYAHRQPLRADSSAYMVVYLRFSRLVRVYSRAFAVVGFRYGCGLSKLLEHNGCNLLKSFRELYFFVAANSSSMICSLGSPLPIIIA